ncbi:penicillin-binding protein 2 [Thermaerobacter marianensis DSM 12885]|uniref:Penicillin-binding protein 2 n=1 Tax=Thermaerobacter marianensis (strain ATCC 700841 / DSM 12885 / JCM 10246 / 7p75a) TaxID=644966 RepID=E6SKD6_THEM7|nr:penicillin-binding transpeptidase domain-containing protein [Thermaerobacter marianensis]ADU52294.1 penicillin-binding protein 2 [Thermaerobacter marianensis DSM 12885]
MNPEERARRQRVRRRNVLMALLVIWTVILLGRLYVLQVVMGDELSEYAAGQRLRKVYVPAPRGQIVDRRGQVLATTLPAYSAYLVYTRDGLDPEARQLLSRILNIPVEAIEAAEAQLRVRPVPEIPVRLKAELTPAEITALAENRDRLPGVIVEPQPLRYYPGGTLAAHVLGYVREGERPWQLRGETGIELTYNGQVELPGGRTVRGLTGVDGQRLVEVDARGRPLADASRYLLLGGDAERYAVPPQPGNTVVLTLDARVQKAAEEALARRIQELRQLKTRPCPCPARNGAAVAIDVRTGAILAMASYPTFDPNDFARQAFMEKSDPRYPAVNRRVQSYFEETKYRGRRVLGATMNMAIRVPLAPGSTFKPVTALAAMLRGALPGSLYCNGRFPFAGGVWEDWQAHGYVDFNRAIGRSCNVYFYQAGLNTGIEAIDQVATQFGLGQPTGLRDLPGERAGTLASPEVKAKVNPKDPRWYAGDTLNTSIGQGLNAFTPLQMAVYTATLANGGTRYRPYLVQEIRDPQTGRVLWEAKPDPLNTVDIPTAFLERVRQAMVTVTRDNGGWYGTAYGVFRDAPYVAAGKTGTAQAGSDLPEYENHGWFIAFAPAGPGEEPEIAVAVVIHAGGGGALAAGPVARAVLDAYFAGRYGLTENPVEAAQEARQNAARSVTTVPAD